MFASIRKQIENLARDEKLSRPKLTEAEGIAQLKALVAKDAEVRAACSAWMEAIATALGLTVEQGEKEHVPDEQLDTVLRKLRGDESFRAVEAKYLGLARKRLGIEGK